MYDRINNPKNLPRINTPKNLRPFFRRVIRMNGRWIILDGRHEQNQRFEMRVENSAESFRIIGYLAGHKFYPNMMQVQDMNTNAYVILLPEGDKLLCTQFSWPDLNQVGFSADFKPKITHEQFIQEWLDKDHDLPLMHFTAKILDVSF